MAIADRLNKLRTDIEDTYQAINEIGGTIPSDKNTNNIPEAIRSVYDNLPKVSDTGTNVSLSPTLKGRLGIVPKGNTLQDGTPTPDTPVKIQSATGTQKVVVSGKNLANINEIEKTNNATIELNDNGFTYTRIAASSGDLFVATLSKQLKPNTTYSTYMTKDTSNFLYFYADKLFGNSLQRNQIAYTAEYIAYTFTTDSTGYVVIGFYSTNSSQGETGTIGNIVLTEGVKTIEELQKYQPYQEPQEVDIELSNIKLNKIGNYEDYIGGTPDNWVLYKNIGKVVLDGSSDESWSTYSNSGVTNKRFITTISDIIERNSSDVICNRFQKGLSNVNDNFIQTFASKYVWLGSTQIEDLDLAQFKTWLSTHNTEVLYVLATGTTETITDTNLISQLNELYYLQSYNDTTNIDVTGNLPMRITASAIKGA